MFLRQESSVPDKVVLEEEDEAAEEGFEVKQYVCLRWSGDIISNVTYDILTHRHGFNLKVKLGFDVNIDESGFLKNLWTILDIYLGSKLYCHQSLGLIQIKHGL